MSNKSYSITLKEVVSSIEISDADYERAYRRYTALGEWFSRPQAKSAAHDPHISPQGSFRIGTVVKPIDQNEPYDLDMGCRLRKGVTKQTHTQKQLKTLVGDDLEAYRVENRITQQREEKNRCWRLRYKDQLEFHMDVVPSIPVTADKIQLLQRSLEGKVQNAVGISDLCASITDKTKLSYDQKSDDWLISNTEGYALWFESRMSLAMLHMKRAMEGLGGTIDDLPRWRWKTPLQRVDAVELAKGLHYIGEWHTHPQLIPRPSLADLESMRDTFSSSRLELNYLVMVILGYGALPGAIWVSIHNNIQSHTLAINSFLYKR